MKTKQIVLILISGFLIFNSCSEDTELLRDPFAVAFESLSKNLNTFETETTINLVYSEVATESGTVSIRLDTENAIYGQDFITTPEAVNNVITLSVTNGDSENTIHFTKLNSALDETTNIVFVISEINYNNSNIQGNSSFTINSSPALGGSLVAEVGGPNQENQVFIDLSTETATAVKRDSWDLGFYNGENFRVTINGSIYMATKALEYYNIDEVTEVSVENLKNEVAVGTFNPDNAAYVDAPNGDILETAIDEISVNNNENPVYLVNMGYEVGTSTPTTGSVQVAGAHRGWKKVRILLEDNNYVLQYANLDATTHQQIVIPKKNNYNFSYFSFNTNSVVDVEPEKEKWDVCFTVFTNIIEGAGSYGFSDFVIHNRKGNVQSYQADATIISYDDFLLQDVELTSFSLDQTTIGSNWRDVFSRATYTDRFYVLKDSNGNIYKIKFLTMTNNNGERGYPEFQYELLNNI